MIEIIALEDWHRPEWLPLWKGYQRFYEVDIDDGTTAETWRRLMDPAEPMFVLGALRDGVLVGIVHFIFHRSTWTTGDYAYLQDLFMAPDASRVYWLTREDNATAIALYEKVALPTGFIQFRIDLPHE